MHVFSRIEAIGVLAAVGLVVGCGERKSAPTAREALEEPGVPIALGEPFALGMPAGTAVALSATESADLREVRGGRRAKAPESPMMRRALAQAKLGALRTAPSGNLAGSGYGRAAGGGLSGLYGPASAPNRRALAVESAPTRLDPNARYATTYRPGGAALAALDAALARGVLPAGERALVADLGARYAPDLAAPSSDALAIRVDTERAAIPPRGGALHLRVALRSAMATPPRARLAVHLVMDVSGSMEGAAIENARRAAVELVRRLDDGDRFSLVTFASDAQVVIDAGTVGPRREALVRRIERVKADGGTNISAGLDLGYAHARRGNDDDSVPIVMLLSDGQANAGDTDPSSLAARAGDAFHDGVQTSAFGLGQDFDAPLMAALAGRGGGGYYYLAQPEQIAGALARELDARLRPAALAVEVRVRLRRDVAPTKVYGSRQLSALEAQQVRAQEIGADRAAAERDGIRRDRQQDSGGGMRFFIPAFSRDDHHALLLALELPPGSGERSIASVEVRYKDRLRRTNVTAELPVKVRYAADDASSAATASASVARTIQACAAGDTLLAAAERVEVGERDAAVRLLGERAAILHQAAASLREPRFVDDARRVERLATVVGGQGALLPVAMLLRGSGQGYLR